MVHQRLDDFEIIFHISPGMDQPARFDGTRKSVSKEIGEQPATPMSAFPPRIGKIDMNRIDRMWGEVVVKGPVDIAPQHTGVGNLSLLQSFGRAATFFVVDFDTEIIDVRIALACGNQMQATTAADIEFDRIGIPIEFGPVNQAGEVVNGAEPGEEILARGIVSHGSSVWATAGC